LQKPPRLRRGGGEWGLSKEDKKMPSSPTSHQKKHKPLKIESHSNNHKKEEEIFVMGTRNDKGILKSSAESRTKLNAEGGALSKFVRGNFSKKGEKIEGNREIFAQEKTSWGNFDGGVSLKKGVNKIN